MFIKIKSLHKVKGAMCFKQIEEKFIYCDSESNLICLKYQEFDFIWQISHKGIVQINNNMKESFHIIINEGFSESTYIIDFEGNFINEYSFKIYPIESEKSSFISIAINDEIGVFNKIENRIFWILKDSFGGSYWGNTDYIIYNKFDDTTVITNRKTETGSLLWQYSVTEIGKYQNIELKEGEVRRIIGVFDGVLVVNISGGSTQHEGQVIGLAVETGELLWQIQNLNQRQIYHLRVNEAQSHLYTIKDQEYLVIDLKTAQISTQKHLGEVLQHKGKAIKVIALNSKGDHLFFTAMYEGKSLNSGLLGAFNTQTEQLDWIHDMEFGNNCFFTASSAPTLEDNRLYALDSSGTLHIFERE